MFVVEGMQYTLHKKRNFPLRISPENVTKPAGSCGTDHIYERNP